MLTINQVFRFQNNPNRFVTKKKFLRLPHEKEKRLTWQEFPILIPSHLKSNII